MPRGLRAPAVAVALVLAGGLTGIASVAVHDRLWGLPLAVLASLAGLLALPAGWATRVAFAAGWSTVVLLVTRGRPEGDVPVGPDVAGWCLVLLAAVLPCLAVVTALSVRRRGRTG